MKIIRLIFFILVLIAVQATIVDLIEIRGFKPDLILLFLLYRFSGKGTLTPVFAGFSLGLLQDLTSGGFLGVFALSKSVAGFIIGKIFPEKIPEEKWFWLSGIILCIFMHDIISQYIFSQGNYSKPFVFLVNQALPQMVYDCFAAVLLLILPFKRR